MGVSQRVPPVAEVWGNSTDAQENKALVLGSPGHWGGRALGVRVPGGQTVLCAAGGRNGEGVAGGTRLDAQSEPWASKLDVLGEGS